VKPSIGCLAASVKYRGCRVAACPSQSPSAGSRCWP
jgi:hypothetical protein